MTDSFTVLHLRGEAGAGRAIPFCCLPLCHRSPVGQTQVRMCSVIDMVHHSSSASRRAWYIRPITASVFCIRRGDDVHVVISAKSLAAPLTSTNAFSNFSILRGAQRMASPESPLLS